MLSKLIVSFFAVALLSTGAVAQEQSLPETQEESTAEPLDIPEAPAPAHVPAPPPVPTAENTLYLDLSTGGRVTIQLFQALAPNHVERIKTLTRQGFYDGVIFHRVIDGFMAQTGDPTGTGMGGSELPDLKAEFHAYPHLRGVVSMARAADADSANSQFFIVFYPRFSLDKNYTVFGRVTGGMEYVDAINRGEPPANPSRILQASIAADGKAPPMPGASVQQPDTQSRQENITVDELNAPLNP